MNSHEFSLLNKLEQSRLISTAKWISSKKSATAVTVLYKIDQFYVEGYYSWPGMKLLELNSDVEVLTVESYSVKANINPVTNSEYKSIYASSFDQRFVA